MGLSADFIKNCKIELIEKKQNLLNVFRESHMEFKLNSSEKGGDEMDQTTRIMAEKDALQKQKRIRELLLEIESALYRIERGCYGICEETHEPIEVERLMLLPWTRLSIEGAEIREAEKAVGL